MAMETMMSCLQRQYDLAEIYSPSRVVNEANGIGMKGAFSLDSSAPDPDGYIWDFNKHECRQKAFALIRESRPYMIIGFPECTPFSTIQNLNTRTPEGKEKIEKAREEGTRHLEFCCKIYALQISREVLHPRAPIDCYFMGHSVHDKASRMSSGLHCRGPHVRIRYAVQG